MTRPLPYAHTALDPFLAARQADADRTRIAARRRALAAVSAPAGESLRVVLVALSSTLRPPVVDTFGGAAVDVRDALPSPLLRASLHFARSWGDLAYLVASGYSRPIAATERQTSAFWRAAVRSSERTSTSTEWAKGIASGVRIHAPPSTRALPLEITFLASRAQAKLLAAVPLDAWGETLKRAPLDLLAGLGTGDRLAFLLTLSKGLRST